MADQSHPEIKQYLEQNGFLNPELVADSQAYLVFHQLDQQLQQLAVLPKGLQHYERDITLTYRAFDAKISSYVDIDIRFKKPDYQDQFMASAIQVSTDHRASYITRLKGEPITYAYLSKQLAAQIRAGKQQKNQDQSITANAAYSAREVPASDFKKNLDLLVKKLRKAGFEAIRYGGGSYNLVDRIEALGKHVASGGVKEDVLRLGVPGLYSENGHLTAFKAMVEMDLSMGKCKIRAVHTDILGTPLTFLPGTKQAFETPAIMSSKTLQKQRLGKSVDMFKGEFNKIIQTAKPKRKGSGR